MIFQAFAKPSHVRCDVRTLCLGQMDDQTEHASQHSNSMGKLFILFLI